MRILFLTDNFPPEVNAAASRVYERACYWVEWGHEVTVLTCVPNFPEGKVYEGYKNQWYQESSMDGIRVIRVKTLIKPNQGTISRTLDFVSYMIMSIITGVGVRPPDVIIATSPQFFAGMGGCLLSFCKNKPFVLELSDLWPASISAVGALRSKAILRFLEFWERWLYKHSQAIVPVTEAFGENLKQRGVDAQKITVIRNGVDLKRLPQKIGKDEQLCRYYNLTNQFVVGYIGTLGMAHGLENVLYAAKHLQHETSIKFMLMGSGAEKQRLKQLAERLQLKNVLFLPKQPKETVARYWSLCDVSLIHLKNHRVFSEVIPSKIFESMAMAKPMITSLPQGEATELIKAEQCGICVTPGDPEALANGVLSLYGKPRFVETYAKASEKAAPKYSRERQAHDMLQVLQRVHFGEQ